MDTKRIHQRGFTLLEALITVSLLLGALWASVGLSDFLLNNRRDAALNDLLATANYARSQAVTRGTRVTLCASSGQQSCDGGSGWERGWIVFPDSSNPGIVDRGEEIYRQHGPLPSGFRLRGNGSLANRISFGPLGTSLGFAGTLTLCDRRGFGAPPGVRARQLKFTTGGRARVVIPATGGNCA